MEFTWAKAVMKFLFERIEKFKSYFFVNYEPKTWAEAYTGPSPNRPSDHPPKPRCLRRNKHVTSPNGSLTVPTVNVRPATPLDRVPSAVVPPATGNGLAPPPEEYTLKKAKMTAEQFNEIEGPIAHVNGPKVTGSGSVSSLDRDEYLKCMTMKVDYKRRSVAEWGKVRASDAVSVAGS